MAIGFGTAPIVYRIFGPTEVGAAAVIESIVLWVTAFSCLGYASAIPLSAGRGETRALIRLCLLLTFVLLLPVLLLTWLGRSTLADLMGNPAIGRLIWLVPVLFSVVSLRFIISFAFSKERLFGWLAFAQSSDTAIARPVQIVLGWAAGGSAVFILLGTVVGGITSLAVAAFMFLPILLKEDEDDNHPSPTLADVARHHRQFPKAHMWSLVLQMTSRSLPVLLMGAFFSMSAVGYYNQSRKLLMLPLTILAYSIAAVFYPEAATEWRKKGTVSDSFSTTARILVPTCIFPIMAVGLMGPLIFKTFLGSMWYEAGVYAQILAPWVLVALFASPAAKVFLIVGRADLLVVFIWFLMVLRATALVVGTGAGLVMSPVAMTFFTDRLSSNFPAAAAILESVRPAVLIAGKWFDGPRIAVLLFSGASIAVHLPMLFTAMRMGHVRRRTFVSFFAREALRALIVLAPPVLIYWIGNMPWLALGVLCASGVVHYALLVNREPAAKQLVSDFMNRFLKRA